MTRLPISVIAALAILLIAIPQPARDVNGNVSMTCRRYLISQPVHSTAAAATGTETVLDLGGSRGRPADGQAVPADQTVIWWRAWTIKA